MREITINCVGAADSLQLHELLVKSLGLPDHDGNDLDALYDCLTEISQETHVTFFGLAELEFAEDFRSTLLNAESDNFWLSISLE